MEAAAKKKEEEAKQQASYLKGKQIDKFAQQKRFQLLSVKEAINNNTMTIDRANEILFNQVRSENQKIVKAMSGKNLKKMKQFMRFIFRDNSKLDSELKEYFTQTGRKYAGSPGVMKKQRFNSIGNKRRSVSRN